MTTLVDHLQAVFGIAFSDQSLLDTAFTHTSYANEHRLLKVPHNERLEFLGDAVLQLIISQYLYQKYPKKPEGDLSKLRSAIVREESLADFSRRCGFDRFIKLGKGEEKTGGRQRAAILADLFEAFLGALLLDKGINCVEDFLQEVVITQVEQGNYAQVSDYKTALQEFLQSDGDVTISYQVVNETGPAHAKVFGVAVFVDGTCIGMGEGKSKKIAEQAAAKIALDQLQRG
ncbi:ribonuclease III [Streptococcus entericus]|uniref:ribonuclease III n=1 Tax=Streptococcus entericus TaxID=155680 RepID=UPI0003787069|nr:ribonuclease III [Streptococcus entericus]